MVRLGQDHQVSPARPGGQRGCCERVSLKPQKPFFPEVQRGWGGRGRNLDDQSQAG